MGELKRTSLHQVQLEAGAKLVPFAGWEMPLHFGSQIAEHQAVRDAAGVFDVSHMAQVDVIGEEAEAFLRYLLVGDVGTLEPGRALYSLALNESAGILDDLMVYRTVGATHASPDSEAPEGGRGMPRPYEDGHQSQSHPRFRIVFNASTREKLANWLEIHGERFAAEVHFRDDLAMLAIQGPSAIGLAEEAIGGKLATLDKFSVTEVGESLVARTGYTGEDGVEIMMPGTASIELWNRLGELGIHYCGLGARDTLRLEAGLNLYGQDMDESTHPLESRLGWTVAWNPDDRDFIGRKRLQEIAEVGSERELKGIRLMDKGVMRPGSEVETPSGRGVVTSGSYSPSLGYSIGLARVPAGVKGEVRVIIRGVPREARVVSPRFISMLRREK